jgi:hypothetical protein
MLGAVVGIGLAENAEVSLIYIITYDDKNGDGKIKGDDETNTQISVSTSAKF